MSETKKTVATKATNVVRNVFRGVTFAAACVRLWEVLKELLM